MNASDISAAFSSFQSAARGNASLGFSGTAPCGQTAGQQFIFPPGTTPTQAGTAQYHTQTSQPFRAELTVTTILYAFANTDCWPQLALSGQYSHRPVLFGATSYEGSFVYGTLVNEWLSKANLTDDSHFLTYEMIPTLLQTTGVSNYYPVKELLRDSYFSEGTVGELSAMLPGVTDLLSVFFIKAASYELVQQNSGAAPSYMYSFEYDSPMKHLYNVFMLGWDHANVTHPGPTHCEEIPYLFDVEIPLIFCDLDEMIQASQSKRNAVHTFSFFK